MLQSSLLWYKKLRKVLEGVDFRFNPYDPCVGSIIINGHHHTKGFHAEYLMLIRKDTKINDEFLKWLNDKYGEHGEVRDVRVQTHDYLGNNFD